MLMMQYIVFFKARQCGDHTSAQASTITICAELIVQ